MNRLYFFLAMAVIQMFFLIRILIEARRCRWSASAKWITRRIGFVLLGVIAFTLFTAFMFKSDDDFSIFILGISIAAMTALIGLHLPVIINAMSDDKIAEDLNLHEKIKDDNYK